MDTLSTHKEVPHAAQTARVKNLILDQRVHAPDLAYDEWRHVRSKQYPIPSITFIDHN